MFYKTLILLALSFGISTSQDQFRNPTDQELDIAQRYDEYTGRKEIIIGLNKLSGHDDEDSPKLVCRDFGTLPDDDSAHELVYANVINITGKSINGTITWDHNFLPHFTSPSCYSQISHVRVIQECYANVPLYQSLGVEIRTVEISSDTYIPMNLFLKDLILVQLQITGGDWVIKNPPPYEKKLFRLTFSDSVNVKVMIQDKILSRDDSKLLLQNYRF